MHTPRRRRALIGSLVAGLVASPLALGFTAPAQAASATVVINEVYGGGGNNNAPFRTDFVELYNPTGTAVDVTGWSVQYRSGNGTTANITELTGTVPAGGYYLVSQADGAGTGPGAQAPLPAADADGDAAMSGTSGVVILASDTTEVSAQGDFAVDSIRPANVVDTVGYGTGATTFETARTAAPANPTSVARVQADSDNNSTNFAVGAPAPQNSGRVGVTNPGDKVAAVNEPITDFTVAAAGGTTPYTFSSSTLPPGLTIGAASGTVTGTPTTPGRYDVTVTVTDSAATPASSSTTFVYRVLRAPAARSIAAVQGTGSATPVEDLQPVIVEGVVTAAYPTGGLDGFFLQTGGTGSGTDATPGASDGIFVTAPVADIPDIGDSVEVTGRVSESFARTQIAADDIVDVAALPAVTPASLPWSELDTDAEKEAHEGELIAPAGDFTVTNSFTINNFGEVGLASGTTPLIQPTEVRDFQTGNPAEITAQNDARKVVLDDGSSANYLTGTRNANLPWLAPDGPVRVGAPVTFTGPVALDFGFGLWRFQPTSQVTGTGADTATFENTREDLPQAVPGDVRIATFNVLNYFPTTGEEFDAVPGNSCDYFTDRQGNRIAVDDCGSNGPRGAANAVNLARQQAKIVDAINKLDASVVSLEELENSVKLGKDRDFAIGVLVDALNADAGAGTWAFAPSPDAADLPTPAQEDVIRTGFIYKPADVQLLGGSVVLKDEVNFDNAREPLAQAFQAVGTERSKAFAVVVNHFKSKGCSNPPLPAGTPNAENGQGCFTEDRIGQAEALKTFAASFAAERNVRAVFLAGDFNSYSQEDPLQVLTGSGYTAVESDTPGEETYSFSGLSGSLDHVLANPAALGLVAGADIWNINSPESTAYQYSRYNYNANSVALFREDPFSSSDHDPEIVGLDFAGTTARVDVSDRSVREGDDVTVRVSVSGPGATPTGSVGIFNSGVRLGTGTLSNGAADVVVDSSALTPGTYRLSVAYGGDAVYDSASTVFTLTVLAPTSRDVQILATNDFHGRIANDTSSGSAGAAVLAGAVKQFKAANPATSFVAAGDLIGASTFESFIAQDKPTIDALNEAGLDVSAVGNHEFDQGYDDLINRVIAPYDPETNPFGGAEWTYLGANVKLRDSGNPALEPSLIMDQGGIQVGYIGAVTEDLPELVSPDGISEIQVTDIVAAANTEADALQAEGADVIVLLVHEGASGTNCATINTDTTSNFGKITSGVNDKIDAIVSGHTHLVYNCSQPVPAWADRPVKERPIVSAGQYGTNLNQLVFTVDIASGEVQAKTQAVLPLKTGTSGSTFNYPVDATTQTIVTDAVRESEILGAEVIGQISGTYNRAKLADGTTENRGGESTLGNLVAEIQREQTSAANRGGAQIAFMNPGGLRADLVGTVNGATRDVTFKQAATVQPFANTLVNEALTGAEIKAALEQQWQPAGSSRPFLKLGISKGFSYTYDPGAAQGSRIKTMTLDGVPIDLTATYSVTVNSFLAAGGDNFPALNGTGRKQDTGVTDLQAQVDYFAAQTGPLAVDYSQRAVGTVFPAGAPASYAPGDDVAVDLTSLSMTGPGDVTDTSVEVRLEGGAVLGSFPVSTTKQTALPGFDEAGTATTLVTLPADLTSGDQELVVTGNNTGTVVRIPISVEAETPVETESTTVAVARETTVEVNKNRTRFTVTVSSAGSTPTGTVSVRIYGDEFSGELVDGVASIAVGPWTRVGPTNAVVTYSGDATTAPSSDTVRMTVVKQTPTLRVSAPSTVRAGTKPTITVALAGTGAVPSGRVRFSYNGGSAVQTLSAGRTTRTLPGLTRSTTVTVTYLGDSLFGSATDSVTIRVAP